MLFCFFVWNSFFFFFLIILHCADHKALTSKPFFSTGTDLPGLWHRASCWAGTDWVHFQLTSIYLPVIASSWLFALALHLQIAPVLSKGLTDAGILDSISNFKHQFDCVCQPRHLHTLPLFDFGVSINSKGDRCDWLQPLNAVRHLRTLGNRFLPVFPLSRAAVKFGKDQAE